MTVKQLIELLQELEQDKKIMLQSQLVYHEKINIKLYPPEYQEEWQEEFYYIS